ncbi:MAG: hypothetical protein ACRC0X_00230 [Brevinema sp.]
MNIYDNLVHKIKEWKKTEGTNIELLSYFGRHYENAHSAFLRDLLEIKAHSNQYPYLISS